MNTAINTLSQRERELAAIISAYNGVTEQLKNSHEALNHEVRKLRLELEDKNHELARRQRLAALGEMAAGVAHEIRNPLGSIRLYSSLLERDLAALPESQRLVRRISAGVFALDRIVGDVLDFAGRHEPDPRSASLQLIISNVFEMAAARAQEKRIVLHAIGETLNLQVWVDPAQIERAVLNVVLNAVDAVSERGSITVAAETDLGGVLLHVSDDGPGIPSPIMDRIFNPFFTTKEQGTGLGLAIAHRIMESHGARITVCNQPNSGARFTFHLPAGPDSPTGHSSARRFNGSGLCGG